MPSNDSYTEQLSVDKKLKVLKKRIFGSDIDRKVKQLFIYYKSKKELCIGDSNLTLYDIDTISFESRIETTSEFSGAEFTQPRILDIYRRKTPENLGIYEFSKEDDELTLTSLYNTKRLPDKEMMFMMYEDFYRFLHTEYNADDEDFIASLLGKILIIAGGRVLEVEDDTRFIVYKVYHNEYGRK